MLLKRILLEIFLMFLLINIATLLASNIKPCGASETIIIHADGTVSPETANITRTDEFTYTFNGSNYDSLVIERDNITVDGAGFAILTNSGNGISMTGRSNITIKNLNIDVGSSYYGIYLYSSSNITVFNCNIYLSGTGIIISDSSHNNIYGNNISKNAGDAIGFYGSSEHNRVHNNTIESNSNRGVYLAGSHNSICWNNITDNALGISVGGNFQTIYGNNVIGNKRTDGLGILIASAGGGCNVSHNYVAENKIGFFLQPGTYQDCAPNILKGNGIVNNSLLNFGILNYNWAGDTVAKLYNDVDVSNTVNGKPIYYWINRENDTIPSDAGFVALINCRNITVENLTLERNLEGALLAFSNNCTILGNNVTNNGEQLMLGGGGIVLYRSSNNIIYRNNVATDHWTGDGITLETYSSHNTVFENNFTKTHVGVYMQGNSHFNNISSNILKNSSKRGISLEYSSNTTVHNNKILGPGEYGIYLGAQYNNISENNIIAYKYGLYVTGSRNTIVENNIMENWEKGIFAGGSYNTFFENNIINNNEGVYLYGQNNLFFHNNFVDNTKHVTYYWSGIGNSWNKTYPIGGNYWSGYEEKYPNAKELDNSGLWDTPYVINENNIDYYPLMAPTKPITRKFTAYDSIQVEICSNSSISAFQFNTANKTLQFNITGPMDKSGFCNVTVPANLLWGNFSLFIDGFQLEENVNYTGAFNETHYLFYIIYVHSGRSITEIKGTEAISEFPQIIILPLLITLSTIAFLANKKHRNK